MITCFSSCNHAKSKTQNSIEFKTVNTEKDDTANESVKGYVSVDSTNSLLNIYHIDFSNIDLVCGKMPSKNDTSVIFCAEAAFTGELLNKFNHRNIAGDHVSNGVRYKGFRCSRNSGAFVYYNNEGKFMYNSYSEQMDIAAKNGGMGFGQEMMIHNGSIVPHKRKDSNVNSFRALCSLNDNICVIDSKTNIKFGSFINELLKIGVTEALYLDMGTGWNYSWYRNKYNDVVEIFPIKCRYCTNWITFYK